MIVSCPSCATRHNFQNALRAPGSVKVICRSCGHKWIEIEDDDDVIDVEPLHRTTEPLFGKRQAHVSDAEPSEYDIQRLLNAAKDVEEKFFAHKQQRKRAFAQWMAYCVVMLLPFAGLAAFPDQVVSAAPAAIRAYEALGVGVNIYGLEIRRIKQQHAIVKGSQILTITGEVVNITDETKKIPWLRFGLRDAASKEVYDWTLNTEARPLRPGETTSFVTRIAAPPQSATDVQIRFAREGEISSNSGS